MLILGPSTVQRLWACVWSGLVAVALQLVALPALGQVGPAPSSDPIVPDPLPAASVATSGVPQAPPTPGQRALAAGASFIPGLLLHGSGHFVLGRTAAAGKLFALQGVGIGLMAAGIVPLVASNASRFLSRSSATLLGLGTGFFTVSSLADLYGVLVPLDSRGHSPRRAPMVEAELGYRFVDAPPFSTDSFVVNALSLRWHALHVQPSAWLGVDDRHARWRLLVGYRPFGPSAGRGPSVDGSYVELQGAVTQQRYRGQGFDIRTWEMAADGRVDLRQLDRDLKGMFAVYGLGMALQRFDYDALPVSGSDSEAVLLLKTGFGVYLGGDRPPHGEITSYYDHRHDDFAGGINDRAIGIPGHIGFSGKGYMNDVVGLKAVVEYGAGWVAGGSLLMRTPL